MRRIVLFPFKWPVSALLNAMFAAGMVIALDNATGIRMFRERTDGIMLWTILLVLLVLWLLGLIGGIGGNLVHLLLVVALVVLVIQLITGRRAVI